MKRLSAFFILCMAIAYYNHTYAAWTPQFETPRIISRPSPSKEYNSNLTYPVDILVGYSGAVYVTWKGDLDYKGYRIVSTDKGQTWSQPIAFTHDTTSNFHLTEAPDGMLVATYNGTPTSHPDGYNHFYVRKSPDKGATWGAPELVDTTPAQSDEHAFGHVPAIDANGTLYVVYAVRTLAGTSNTAGFYLMRYNAATGQWTPPVQLVPTMLAYDAIPRFTTQFGKTILTLTGYYAPNGVDRAQAVGVLNAHGEFNFTFFSEPSAVIETCGPISAPKCDPCSNEAAPRAGADARGNLYVLADFIEKTATFDPSTCSRIVNTLASGTWVRRYSAADCPLEPSIVLSSTPGEQKALASAGDGYAVVFYREGLTSSTSHMMAMSGSSLDSCSGATYWGTPVQIDDEATRDKKNPVSAVGPDGTIYVLWELWVNGVLGRVGFTSSIGPAKAQFPTVIHSLLLDADR